MSSVEASSLPIMHVLGSVAKGARINIVTSDETDDQPSEAVTPLVGTEAEVDLGGASEPTTHDEAVAPFDPNNDSAARVPEEGDGAEACEVPPLNEPPTGETVGNDATGSELPELEDSDGVLLVQASLASRHDRQELYDRVWSVPIWTLCKEYGVSDVALAKTCKRLHVPLPGRGYWAILAAGKPTQPRPPLRSVEVVERIASKRKRHRHSPDEAAAVIKRIRAAVEVGKSVRQACTEAKITEGTYYRWLSSISGV